MAIEGAKSIVDCLSCLWNCAVPQVDYIRKLEEKKDALKTAMDDLKALRDDTMNKVRLAELQPDMKRTKQVENWLSGVRDIEVKVEELISEASQENEKKCLGGCCPQNCKASYKLGKIVAKKLKEVADHKSRGSFEAVADKQPLPLVDERPIEPTVGLESTFDEVWRCINEDEGTGIIGLYGLGGVGKTTLLTQINNNFNSTSHTFDVVIWVVVSKNPNFAKVQEDIWKRIAICNSQWNEKTKEDKAKDIFQVLRKKKFVLLLDDIWARFDLLEVGVPLLDEQNKSKVVFTTRSEEVCGQMKAHKIKIKKLAWEKAWGLFRKTVGEDTISFHQEILELAEKVAKECDGLPLALIVIGRAMACKTNPREWQDAVTMLQKSAAKISGMEDEIYHRLKFSYDNLSDDIHRSCFLYCSLFPEDFSISNKTLVEYWICEGFLNGFDDLNEVQNKGQVIIGTLIRACLLEEDSSSSVKMHDMIRDMALWIADKCEEVKKKVLVQAGVNLTKAPEVKKWEGVERVSLMHNGIRELTEVPICPDLLTLFLNDNNLNVITRGFFQKMSNLKVLDLSGNKLISNLPKEISELVSLQYLNLSSTGIKELPIEYKKLVELKYLNLEYTNILHPAGVPSSFKKLLVLKMAGNESIVEDGEFERLVKKVECLKELIEFSITISTTSALSRFLSCHKLPTFTTKLWLASFKGSEYVDLCGLQSMRCLRVFFLFACWDLKHLKAERANLEPCFPSLREVCIYHCFRLKELTCLIFAPNLEILAIIDCYGMEEVIWSEATKEGGYLNPFAKLKRLTLYDLQQLKSIYPNALPFPCLNSIRVSNCPNLKKLPLNTDSAKGCGLVIQGYEDWWNDLEWEDEATRNAFLPSFKSW